MIKRSSQPMNHLKNNSSRQTKQTYLYTVTFTQTITLNSSNFCFQFCQTVFELLNDLFKWNLNYFCSVKKKERKRYIELILLLKFTYWLFETKWRCVFFALSPSVWKTTSDWKFSVQAKIPSCICFCMCALIDCNWCG